MISDFLSLECASRVINLINQHPLDNKVRFGMIKLPCMLSVSQVSCVWDTLLLVSNDVPGHLDEFGKQGRREKERKSKFPSIRLVPYMWQEWMAWIEFH